jgi:F0F1-type ATP synthase assembly protein I
VEDKGSAPSASEFAGIGLQFAASIVLFVFAGQWLDRRLGTGPVFLILGVFVGAGGAFYSMYRKLMAAQKSDGMTGTADDKASGRAAGKAGGKPGDAGKQR